MDLDSEKSRVMVLEDLVFGEVSLPSYPTFQRSLTWWEELGGLFLKGTNSIHKDSTLMT